MCELNFNYEAISILSFLDEQEALQKKIPNISTILDFKEMITDTKKKLEKKFKSKPEVIEGNLKAIERAYNEVHS